MLPSGPWHRCAVGFCVLGSPWARALEQDTEVFPAPGPQIARDSPGLLWLLSLKRVTQTPFLWLSQSPGYVGQPPCGLLGPIYPPGLRPCAWYCGAQPTATPGRGCSCWDAGQWAAGQHICAQHTRAGNECGSRAAQTAPPVRPAAGVTAGLCWGRLGCLS